MDLEHCEIFSVTVALGLGFVPVYHKNLKINIWLYVINEYLGVIVYVSRSWTSLRLGIMLSENGCFSYETILLPNAETAKALLAKIKSLAAMLDFKDLSGRNGQVDALFRAAVTEILGPDIEITSHDKLTGGYLEDQLAGRFASESGVKS